MNMYTGRVRKKRPLLGLFLGADGSEEDYVLLWLNTKDQSNRYTEHFM